MLDDPYFTMADLPDGARVGVLALANALDCDDEPVVRASEFEDLPDGLDHDLPIGPEARFGAVVEWLTRLEEHRR